MSEDNLFKKLMEKIEKNGGVKMADLDHDMVFAVGGFLHSGIQALVSGFRPKSIKREPTVFEILGGVYVIHAYFKHMADKHGIKVEVFDLGASKERPGGVREFFLKLRESLTAEVNQMAMSNGGEVPLSMWEGQRAIGKLHLLDQLEEMLVKG